MNQNKDLTVTVEVLLEEYCDGIVQFSHTHATWIAYSKSDAIVGVAMLMGKGFKSYHFNANNTWYIQAIF